MGLVIQNFIEIMQQSTVFFSKLKIYKIKIILIGPVTNNREFPTISDELGQFLNNYFTFSSNFLNYNQSKIIKIDEENWDTVRVAADLLKSPIKC